MGKIIAFCGAGGTGKTTLVKAFAEKHPEYVIIESQARRVFEEFGVKTEADQDQMSIPQRWILQKAIQVAQLEYLETFKDVPFAISERTQYDQIAYALQYCAPVLGHEEWEWLQSLAERAKKIYRHVFYLPLATFEGQDDGMRRTDFGARLQFDTLLKGVQRQAGIYPWELRVDTVEARLNLVELLVADRPTSNDG